MQGQVEVGYHVHRGGGNTATRLASVEAERVAAECICQHLVQQLTRGAAEQRPLDRQGGGQVGR